MQDKDDHWRVNLDELAEPVCLLTHRALASTDYVEDVVGKAMHAWFPFELGLLLRQKQRPSVPDIELHGETLSVHLELELRLTASPANNELSDFQPFRPFLHWYFSSNEVIRKLKYVAIWL